MVLTLQLEVIKYCFPTFLLEQSDTDYWRSETSSTSSRSHLHLLWQFSFPVAVKSLWIEVRAKRPSPVRQCDFQPFTVCEIHHLTLHPWCCLNAAQLKQTMKDTLKTTEEDKSQRLALISGTYKDGENRCVRVKSLKHVCGGFTCDFGELSPVLCACVCLMGKAYPARYFESVTTLGFQREQ